MSPTTDRGRPSKTMKSSIFSVISADFTLPVGKFSPLSFVLCPKLAAYYRLLYVFQLDELGMLFEIMSLEMFD